MSTSAPHHWAVAETGKLAALRGDHRTALGHYREAMRLAVLGKAPEVFFRHYLEATLESLELMEAFESVLEYCERAIQHYAEHPPQHAVATLDLATIHQRKCVVLLKAGRPTEARVELEAAIERATSIGVRLELAELLRRWLERPCTIPKSRLLAEQRRLHYFSVRPDTVGVRPRGESARVVPAAPRPLAAASQAPTTTSAKLHAERT